MEEQRKAVRAMQVYIREHITEDITPADLANVSNFSGGAKPPANESPFLVKSVFSSISGTSTLSSVSTGV